MALHSVGSQSSDQPKTPTLRQFYKLNGKCPDRSHIKTIFKPNRLPYFTFITDHNFKVVVSEENPLHKIILDTLDEWVDSQCHLVVVVDDGEKGHWSLSVDTDENTDCEEMSWGFRGTMVKREKKRKNQTKLTHDKTAQDMAS